MKARVPGRRAYARLVRLYPRRFRSEYGDEMLHVFESALSEASEIGFAAAAGVWLRELRDLPVSLVRERRWDAAGGVTEASMDVGPGHDEGSAGSGPAAEAPASWRESLAGAGLFLLLLALVEGVYTAVYALLGGQGPRPSPQYETAGGILFALMVLGLMAVACFAWVRGFPRWSFPYLGFGLLFSFLMHSLAPNGTTIMGHEVSRLETRLWQAFVPALIVAGVSLLITRSVEPLRKLAAGVWNDWTRISFAFYGMLPIALIVTFDETHDGALVGMALPLVLAIGALATMRSTCTLQRAASLAAGLAASWLVATAWLTAYWHGRQDPWMTAPADGFRTAIAMGETGALLMVLLLAPGLVGLAHRMVSRRRKAAA